MLLKCKICKKIKKDFLLFYLRICDYKSIKQLKTKSVKFDNFFFCYLYKLSLEFNKENTLNLMRKSIENL